jgi:predicted ATPase/DNA-binding winged helix-turn-helix (wHTH) protein
LSAPPAPADPGPFVFGPFQLLAVERRLLREGRSVAVGGRALDVLIALVRRRGEVVSNEALTATVWPGLFVDETSLRVQISRLRKALDDGVGDQRFITNVAGRGYCFVAPVSTPEAPATPVVASRSSARRGLGTLARIIGREAVIAELADLLPQQRLMTILGPGGIGKTTVARAVAARLAEHEYDQTLFVDLAPIEDPALIGGALASALGLIVRAQDPVGDIAEAIGERRVLIVLDSCEHLIDAAASLAEILLETVPNLDLLATSREALRIGGEWVHNLPPLTTPPAGTATTAAEALTYPAVQMFVDRASAALGGYVLSDADAPRVVEICRRLDGIALAIELATGRLDALGVAQLAEALEDCFEVLTRGRRTALPRHQTLRAALDWSYRILPPAEQRTWRAVSVFNGWFTLASALAVAAEAGEPAPTDRLANLVAKSLISTDLSGGEVRYRLLDISRAYAREKLAEAGEAEALRRRHARHLADLFARAEGQWKSGTDHAPVHADQIDNLRAALDWAFSDEGEGDIGVALTVAAVPLWFQLSLIDEGLSRVQKALNWLAAQPEVDLHSRMRLTAVLGWPQMRAISGLPSGADAWRATLAIAERIGDRDYQGRALWALWVDAGNQGRAAEALDLAERFAAVADDAQDRLIARRIRAWSLASLGRLTESDAEIRAMLADYRPPARDAHLDRFQYDQRLVARITQVRGAWLLGRFDDAMAEAGAMVIDGLALEHTLTLAHVLSDAACFLALWSGDVVEARRCIALLKEHTAIHALDVWRTYAEIFEAELQVREGEVEAGLPRMRRAMATLEAGGFVLHHTLFETLLARACLRAGQVEAALALMDKAEARCAATGEAWCLPEALHVRALAQAARGDASAEATFRAAIDLARGQGALFWELRATVSLARRETSEEARGLLADVLARCPQGEAVADRAEAVALLAGLARPIEA